MLQVTFFLHETCENKKFLSILEKENKPEKYVGIQYSTLSQAPAILDEFAIESIFCV